MSLGTFSSHLWIATVFYYVDIDFNFYIYTSPKTKHASAFIKNDEVVCNIYDSHQIFMDKKSGAQVLGKIEEMNVVEQIKRAIDYWNQTNPGREQVINWENMAKKVISGKMYKIQPKQIQYYSEELYGEEEFEIFNY